MNTPSSPYPHTYYQTLTALPDPARPAVAEHLDVDICIIGGGLSGLCTALSLGERGLRSIVVEKNRVAWGASGRNAGMVISGFDRGMDHVLKKQGATAARQMFTLTTDTIALIRNRIARYGIDCGPLANGTAIISCYDTGAATRDDMLYHNKMFGSEWEYWDRDKTRECFKSGQLYNAIFMPESFHLQPLAYTHGIARAAEQSGATIYENTEIIASEKSGAGFILTTDTGKIIRAGTVVCAGSGYLSGALPLRIKTAVMPIETYIGVTAPLTQAQREASFACAYGAFDNRNVMNYFRLLPDNRLIWGGGHESVSFFGGKPNLEDAMRTDLGFFFPALRDVPIEYLWSGVQGYSRHRMPQIREVRPGFWVNMGHGGQGLTTTALCGDLIARAIAEQDLTYQFFRPYGLGFTGGAYGKVFAAALAWGMKWQDSRHMAKSR